jgi:HEPN domain-containing protein
MESLKPMEDYNEWLKYAKHDLDAAKVIAEGDFYNGSVFWAHDSVEKSLKAFLVFNHKEGDKTTHDLEKLALDCSDLDNSFSTLLPIVKDINGWGEQVSYPDVEGTFDATVEHCETVISVAEKVYSFVLQKAA